MTTQAAGATTEQQTTQTTQTAQQGQNEPDGKALLEKFLTENPGVKPHVVALGKGLFEEDAKALRSQAGKAYTERDVYRKGSKLTPEQVEALTEFSALQEETISDLVEKGAPEDLLREYAELGKKPSEIKAYAKKIAANRPAAEGKDDIAARLERLEALLTSNGAGAQRREGAAREILTPPGPGAPAGDTFESLGAKDTRRMNPKELREHLAKLDTLARSAMNSGARPW